ncbi:MAG: hypothetical protein R2849_19285 [Thermomicrobiales bacterium]
MVVTLLLPLLASCGAEDTFQTGQAAETKGQILFVADGNVMMWRDGDISTLTEDGTAESPTWSPIGDRFAYVQSHGDYSEVVIADRDGDPLVQLTSNDSGLAPYTEDHVYMAAWGKEPDWSPVGEELVYISDKGGLDAFSRNLYIWLSEFGVGAAPYVLPLSDSISLSQSGPAYSPDGRQIAFSVRQDEGAGIRYQEVWTMDLEAAIYEPLVVGTDGAFDPDWSPDGDNIVYVQREGERSNIWIAPVSGDEPYRLADVGGAVEPVWSPDGDQIAFIELVGVDFEVWIMDVDVDDSGTVTAGEPEKLFAVDNIDSTSGLSWFKAN